MSVKYIFITGGVVSSLGKGITAASLGRLLKARGYRVLAPAETVVEGIPMQLTTLEKML